jgi:hypothetical protein
MDNKKKNTSVCNECGKEYEFSRYWQRFCSDPCRIKWNTDLRSEVTQYIKQTRENKK